MSMTMKTESAFQRAAIRRARTSFEMLRVRIDRHGRIHRRPPSRPDLWDASKEGVTVAVQSLGAGVLVTVSGALVEDATAAFRDVLRSTDLLDGRVYLDLEALHTVDTRGLAAIDELRACVVRPSEAADRLRELLWGADR